MPYVDIDNNRFQVVGFSNQQYENQIKVDCLSLSEFYKLKANYQEFQGAEQWELDLLSQFQNAIQYQHDAFDEFSSVTNNQIKTLENLHAANVRAENTSEAERLKALIDGLQDDLLAEQQASIVRIIAITEEYNNAST